LQKAEIDIDMRPVNNNKRARGRPGSGRRPHGGGPNRSFDSNGPDTKVRGTAAQVYDKYCALARDANAAGDHVGAENYQQHAEHYYRIMAVHAEQANARQPARGNGMHRPVEPAGDRQPIVQSTDPAEAEQPVVDVEPPAAE
jgi:hypothetical protein